MRSNTPNQTVPIQVIQIKGTGNEILIENNIHLSAVAFTFVINNNEKTTICNIGKLKNPLKSSFVRWNNDLKSLLIILLSKCSNFKNSKWSVTLYYTSSEIDCIDLKKLSNKLICEITNTCEVV